MILSGCRLCRSFVPVEFTAANPGLHKRNDQIVIGKGRFGGLFLSADPEYPSLQLNHAYAILIPKQGKI